MVHNPTDEVETFVAMFMSHGRPFSFATLQPNEAIVDPYNSGRK
jgi:hypothetical protein